MYNAKLYKIARTAADMAARSRADIFPDITFDLTVLELLEAALQEQERLEEELRKPGVKKTKAPHYRRRRRF